MLAITLLSVPVFLLSLFLMHYSVRIFNIKHLTIAGFFYIFYVARIYIPAFVVYTNYPGDYRNVFMFAVQSVLITFPLGLLLANWLMRFKAREIAIYFRRPIEYKLNFHFKVIFWIFLIIGIGLMLIYIYQIKTIPILYLIFHPGSDLVTLLREQSFKLLPWGPLKYFYSWLRVLIFPFLAMVSFGLWRGSEKKKDSRFWRTSFIVSLLLAVFCISLSATKSGAAIVFLMFFIFWYLFKSGKISKKVIIGFALLVLSIPTFVVTMKDPQYSLGAERLWRMEKAIFERIFYDPAFTLYPYFEVFPDEVGFLHGKSISFSSWFGQEYFDVENYVYKYMFRTELLTGTYIESGSANAAFVGTLWANFGVMGILFGSVLVGMLIQTVQTFLFRSKKTILYLAAYAFLVYTFSILVGSSITTVLLTGGVIIVFIIVFIIKVLEQFLKETVIKQSSENVG